MTSTGGAATSPSAYTREQRLELLALALVRAGALLNVVVALAAMAQAFPGPVAGPALAGGLLAESTGLIAVCYRAGRVVPGWVAVDLGLVVGALFVNAHLLRHGMLHNWGFFVYPFSLVTSLVYGMAFRRLPLALAASCLVGLAYAGASVSAGDSGWNTVPNAVSYLASAPVVWAIVRELRASALAVDASRAHAEASAAELAREQERSRNARLLHDRVLQTMELLARTGIQVLDPRLRDHIAAEAAWLRHLVETGQERDPAGLETELATLPRKFVARGLRVEVNAARLAEPDSPHRQLPAAGVRALLDATAEALTNVAKHAGVKTATVHATAGPDGVTVTVTDAGTGFAPPPSGTPGRGTGIVRSITARMADAGGTSIVHSVPGQGTSIELHLPLPPVDAP